MGIGRVSARTLARAALPLLIAIAGVVAALQLGQIERSRVAARMQVRSGDAARAIQSQIADYTDVLYGIRALYHASNAVDAREFAAQVHATDVSERFPSARGIGVA
jgi:CHASE1-domain containing sensor protein